MSNSSQFVSACNIVKNLNSTPTNDELCRLYGLYKQATLGDNTTVKPSMFDLSGNKKWSSWSACLGLSKYNSEVNYIQLVNNLISIYGVKE